MGERKVCLELDEYERNILFNALNEMRTSLIEEHRPTDAVEDLMLKTYEAKEKKFRLSEGQKIDETYR